MKLGTFTEGQTTRLGVIDGDTVADLGAVAGVPPNLRDLLMRSDRLKQDLQPALRTAPRLPIERVRLEAPIADPRHFFAVGLNYRQHAVEMGLPLPERPRVFTKLNSSIAAPFSSVIHPGFSDTLDYEGELGVMIGKRCRGVTRERARDFVAGFLVINDVSIREWVNPDLLVLGKGCATFAPMGPWLTTADEIDDPHALRIRTHVNGETRQDSTTGDMLFDCWTLIEWISKAVELWPGDIISTGSPPGSGAGLSPPVYLHSGDTVQVAIEGLGEIHNQVIPEAHPAH